MAEIEHGSMREEGEEEEHLDDDESVDPQDRRSPDRWVTQRGEDTN